jgi:hypothetical protein
MSLVDSIKRLFGATPPADPLKPAAKAINLDPDPPTTEGVNPDDTERNNTFKPV